MQWEVEWVSRERRDSNGELLEADYAFKECEGERAARLLATRLTNLGRPWVRVQATDDDGELIESTVQIYE